IPSISIAHAIFGKDKTIYRDFKESLFSLLFCTFGDLFTGIVMGIFTHSLEALPALMVLIPSTIGMRGNIFASLGSRLGTYLHTGQIEPSFRINPLLSQNIISSFTLTLITSIFLGIIAAMFSSAMGLKNTILSLVLVSLIAGILSACVMLIFTFLVAFLTYRLGWNPDNTSAPLITLAGDVVTLPLLFISYNLIKDFSYTESITILLSLLIFFIIPTLLYSTDRDKRYYRRIIRESLPILIICGIIGTFSGTVLLSRVESLIEIPALLILIPPFLEDGGAIGGILASRFSSSLHLGLSEYSSKPSKDVIRTFFLMHLLAFWVFALVGVFGYSIAKTMNIQTLPLVSMVLISVIAGEILVVLVNFVAYYTSMISFKRGIDPDNVAIPVITSVIDLLGAVCFVAVAMTIGFA
ncbi:MAG TPA: hypothetical protein ENG74_02470, partial [Thermoplasmatales archaeon]|nr:hypothetical protein [Thermoplasmatales archaeon]